MQNIWPELYGSRETQYSLKTSKFKKITTNKTKYTMDPEKQFIVEVINHHDKCKISAWLALDSMREVEKSAKKLINYALSC